ncbi:MAG: hypothetical protein HY773_02280 [Candidatus Terrybacteria bacterium]|nr:hypothetical protein [Candidatus Terrybacteria bacterium]
MADTLIKNINTTIVNPLVGLMIAIALVVFLYGVFEYIAGAANEEKRETGKKHIIWGLIGLFIMFGVFGLMNVLASFWR